MFETIVLIALAVLFVINGVSTVSIIGNRRPIVTSEYAAGVLIIDLAIATVCVMAVVL